MSSEALQADKSKDGATPLMKQYEALKAEHQDEILMFRLGDFYEMFDRDAKRASPVLEVALTQRQGIPMCGIPYHAMDRYLSKLLKKGFKVAIAEQMEDPAVTKGIVKRNVVRIISAGTVIEENLLKEKTNNFLAAVAVSRPAGSKAAEAAIAALDISTGEFKLMELEAGEDFSCIADEIARLAPSEVLLSAETGRFPFLNERPVTLFSEKDFKNVLPNAYFDGLQAQLKSETPALWEAARMVQAYLQRMNPAFLSHLRPAERLWRKDTMNLDKETVDNLELVQNGFDGTEQKTLLQFLDRTATSMGARLLRQWVTRPLIHLEKIRERLHAVDFFVQSSALRAKCREALKGCSDIERLGVRVGTGHAGPRDVMGLKNSLLRMHEVKKILQAAAWDGGREAAELPSKISTLLSFVDECPEVLECVQKAISDEPPIQLENGGVIRAGYHAELDEKRSAASEGKNWLAALEAREKEKTGITTLKVGYTSVFGYYFEVTKAHLSKVPGDWHRKQTLVNNERYINEELKVLEGKILGAEEQALRIERALFQEVVAKIRSCLDAVQKTAKAAAELDCLLALAETAELKSLTLPALDNESRFRIVDGWHPIVKEYLPAGSFVPNSVNLEPEENQIIILTGPNMSGKSTYLRQTALIVLMAQIGSFVPAKEAQIGVADRIFTRIGSGDRLAQGESTFMVEMRETARILKAATERSLVILDEVGRGTSTYDGISIAWAVIEHLAYSTKPKVLFATHYFELTQLASIMKAVKNFSVEAKEWKDTVLFMHKIVPGPADRSYGIHVAKLAGLPESVIQKSKKILLGLEREHQSLLKSKTPKIEGDEPSLFSLPKEKL